MKISKILYREDRWCQGSLALLKNGNRIHNLNLYHLPDGRVVDPSRECVAYSLQGAVAHLYNGDSQGDAYIKLGRAAREYVGNHVWLAEFNDSPSTTYKDVMKVLKIAGL